MIAVHSLPSSGEPAAASVLACRLCGQAHRGAPLLRGQRALCVRCGTLLRKRGWFGADAALAFAVTGAALAFPATLLPFITVDKLGREHTGFLATGAIALWEAGMRLLGVWVALCGVAAPALLLGALVWGLARARFGRQAPPGGAWRRLIHALEHWAMPEVHVLAVLVALIKLGSLVNVHIGPGFWCYVAMSVALLVGWRSFDLEIAPAARTSRGSSPAP
jgi:paraquat-inducible protein A